MQRNYPIGIQTFSKIREGDYVYVDKTKPICHIVEKGGLFFLSRPRRFGKSLTLSTMYSLYRGQRDLFTGLWAERGWDWSVGPRPVIWLKFASSAYQTIGLEGAMLDMLQRVAKQYGLVLESGDYVRAFRELIETLAEREGKVVVLVDEYDKPLIDVIGQVAELDARRDSLKAFYSVLKDMDPHLELVFITGVSAFARVSIFSDLNNLNYLMLDERAATLVGITPEELYDVFAEELEKVDREKLREWYNGYSWNGRDFVYNPWSILNYMQTRIIKNFWFQTGTPTFLVKLMKERADYRPKLFEGDEPALTAFNPDAVELLPVLFQTGYLTIKKPMDDLGYYQLDYPNQEVRQSLDRMLLKEYLTIDYAEASSMSANVIRAFRRDDLDAVRDNINAALASIPYDHWKGQNEHFFHAVVYLLFRLAGVHLQTEVHTACGRADLLVATRHGIYVIELKVDQPTEQALEQIDERGYLEAFAGDPRPRYAVAACFSTETKQLEGWRVVPV